MTCQNSSFENGLDVIRQRIKQQLASDGLERGAIALRFILKTMGCEKQREAAGVI